MIDNKMDVVILCGGKGTRLSEETILKPKPMVEVGNRPILWHIMKYYSSFGFNRFILALGYRGEYIKDYFLNYRLNSSDFTMTLNPDNHMRYHNGAAEREWEITFINTGLDTLKGGRIKQLETHINTENFHLTYGDGVSDVNLDELTAFHMNHKMMATVTAVRPPSRFGEMVLNGDIVEQFDEKSQMQSGVINGGFFILNKKIMEYLTNDENCDFEFGPLQTIAEKGELKAYLHGGFWQCMDNIREKEYLDSLATTHRAPWVRW